MKTTTWIYTIIEKIYNDNTTNVFNYSSYDLAIKNFNELKEYYKENYKEYFKDKDNYYISNDKDNPIMDIVDISYIELFYNPLDKDIL